MAIATPYRWYLCKYPFPDILIKDKKYSGIWYILKHVRGDETNRLASFVLQVPVLIALQHAVI